MTVRAEPVCKRKKLLHLSDDFFIEMMLIRSGERTDELCG